MTLIFQRKKFTGMQAVKFKINTALDNLIFVFENENGN